MQSDFSSYYNLHIYVTLGDCKVKYLYILFLQNKNRSAVTERKNVIFSSIFHILRRLVQ